MQKQSSCIKIEKNKLCNRVGAPQESDYYDMSTIPNIFKASHDPTE